MVTACRKYITEDAQKRIWDQDSALVKKKIAVSFAFSHIGNVKSYNTT